MTLPTRVDSAAEAPQPSLAASLFAELAGPLTPARSSVLYKLALAAVAMVMVILPLVYLALIAAALYGVCFHAVNNPTRFRPNVWGALAYVGPIVIGAVVVLFMIKPLFTRRPAERAKLALRHQDQPLLFAFVHRLCDVVGSPRPSQILVDCEVNASAGFRGGLLSFARGELTLTIGLPLAAGLDLRQFTGVLAHEFGHFAQGTAMRLTYIIRGINLWFARVVYERDGWDERLISHRRGGLNAAMVRLLSIVRGVVWAARRLLWALMWVGHAASCLLLRQMEYAADRCEARVAGSATFIRTAPRLPLLTTAYHKAQNDLSEAWSGRQLCDDLPMMVIFELARMPADVREEIDQETASRETGLFDTHPSEKDRIRNAEQENAAGMFTLEEPARSLFSDFAGLCKAASRAFFHELLGEEIEEKNLVPTERLCRLQLRQEEAGKAFRRYMQGCVTVSRPFFPEVDGGGFADSAEAAQALLEARHNMQQMLPDAQGAAARYEAADDRLLDLRIADELQSAGLPLPPEKPGLERGGAQEIAERRQRQHRLRAEAGHILDDLTELARQRLCAGLILAVNYEPLSAVALRGWIDGRLSAAEAIRGAYGAVLELRDERNVMEMLVARVKSDAPPPRLAQRILGASGRCGKHLERIREALAYAVYPYEHPDGPVTVAAYAVGAVPPEDDVGGMLSATAATLEVVLNLYFRLLGDLSQLAEGTETLMGLKMMEEPEEVFSSPAQSA